MTYVKRRKGEAKDLGTDTVLDPSEESAWT